MYDEISTIKEDGAGNIWLGGARGFSILDPKDFSIKPLTTSNGLPAANISEGNILSTPTGDWIVMTTTGIIRFNPNTLHANTTRPQVLLQSLTYLKQDKAKASQQTVLLDGKQEVEVKHNENRVTFQYAGIHYANPALNQYQYKLDGYDKDWVSVGTERTATYTNLSPGTYTFSVMAANSDGVWSQNDASVKVVIHPPWWATWWAYTLYALVFMLAVWAYISHRSRALRRENKLLEEKVAHRTQQLEQSLEDLKATQTQLIQSEKMASLGELTAGIAHEIQNPLNFVNNFAEVSSELLEEMDQELAQGDLDEARAIAGDVRANLEKIHHHGQRADSIVKNMLQHSRSNSSQKEPTDLNTLVDEYLRLSYHGLRAKDKSFNATMETDFDPAVGKVEMLPQDMGRVLLNLFNNAFYSVQQKKAQAGPGYAPTVYVSTSRSSSGVAVRVRDNGMGIPQAVLDKIYQPFFTTKPTGEGTGLGLSMSYDIVTKGHGGTMKAQTQEGQFAEFDILLPA